MTEEEALLSDGGEELTHESGRNDRSETMADMAVAYGGADGIPR